LNKELQIQKENIMHFYLY